MVRCGAFGEALTWYLAYPAFEPLGTSTWSRRGCGSSLRAGGWLVQGQRLTVTASDNGRAAVDGKNAAGGQACRGSAVEDDGWMDLKDHHSRSLFFAGRGNQTNRANCAFRISRALLGRHSRAGNK